MMWEVYHGSDWRRFYSFEAAERWARRAVATVNDGGFSEPASIYNGLEVAEVRLSGDGRVWTDHRGADLHPDLGVGAAGRPAATTVSAAIAMRFCQCSHYVPIINPQEIPCREFTSPAAT
jgi:hypothetical protein